LSGPASLSVVPHPAPSKASGKDAFHDGTHTSCSPVRQTPDITFDTAFAALVQDLAERGMLDDTLVVVNAEFGRTPTINKSAGRDHWPWVYSLVLAGAGIRAGTVYGASDNSAAYPTDRPHDPKDLAATIYHLLGIDAQTVVVDRTGRPYSLVIGRPIEGTLA